ncbi:hypothetical protein [Streptomyces sp. NPDC026673]|uniref:hypothetical protein n=1 Tax=Streptomyces sp. NPDC026673 TaxID=3155724 RepID=UPI0034090DA6
MNGRPQAVPPCGIRIGAILTAPLPLLAGGPAYDRCLRRRCREEGPGPPSEEDGWTRPGYRSAPNSPIRGLI